MMSYDADPTELPTQRRLDEARDRGHVPRSSVLVSATSLIAVVVGLALIAPHLWNISLDRLRQSIRGVSLTDLTATKIRDDLLLGMEPVGMTCAVFLMLCGSAAITANVVQFGILWKPGVVFPRADRIDPAVGLRRLAGIRSIWHLGLTLLAIMLVSVTIWFLLPAWSTGIITLGQTSPVDLPTLIGDVVFRFSLMLAVTLVGVGLVDAFVQRWLYHRDLRMTTAELREELRRAKSPRRKQRSA